MQDLITAIQQYISVNKTLASALEENFTLKQLNKDDLLIREGQYNVSLAFIKSGILRCYNLKNGRDITNDFFFAQTFVTDYQSLLKNIPARQNFAAIEKCEVYTLSREQLFELSGQFPVLREWGAKMTEILLSKYLANNQSLIADSPEERYLQIVQNQPIILEKIPLHYVASYLGITQVHLSRIRKKIR